MTVPRAALWLALPAVGLLELAGHFYFRNQAPSLEQWREVAPEVARLREARELVVVSPRWAEPLARHALGDEQMPLADVARADATAHSRAIEVGILGTRSEELGGWRVISEKQSDKFLLRVLENPTPARVQFDFIDGARPERASVFEVREGQRLSCPFTESARVSNGGLGGNPTFPARRFDCPSGEWFFVGQTVIDDQEFRPRRCLWAHPTPGGPLVLRYSQVPLGEVVRGYGGLPWLLFRDGIAGTVEVEVRVGDRSIGVHTQRSAAWTPFSFATGAAGSKADVEFEIRSENVADKHFCFQADTR